MRGEGEGMGLTPKPVTRTWMDLREGGKVSEGREDVSGGGE